MELGVNLNYLLKNTRDYSPENTVRQAVYAKELGFTVLDYVSDIGREDWKAHAERIHGLFEENGIVVHQSHAPFNRYNKTRSHEEFYPYVLRSVEAAAILGSKYVVVHADEYRLAQGEEYDGKKVAEWIYDYLAPVVEFAKKLGVGIAIEDLFEDAGKGKPRSRYTSTLDELSDIIERFNDDAVTCCWDFGHAAVAYGFDGAFDAFKAMFPRISCTHVHDNYYNKDLHLLPFQGNLDWEAHMKYMRENGYKGNFTYEFVYGNMPPVLFHDYLLFAKKIADHLFTL